MDRTPDVEKEKALLKHADEEKQVLVDEAEA